MVSIHSIEGGGTTSQRTRERLIGRLMEQGITHWGVLDVMRSTPRHIFLDEALSYRAYDDVALPIGHNQTISQPYIVARMTEAVVARAGRHDGRLGKVLEIGTGCGYQTAIIAQLADEVFTVERIKPLLDRARRNLSTLGLRNVRFKFDDGHFGWPQHAPYDAIIAAAAPHEVPPALLEQLADGGRLVIPVGGDEVQELRLIERQGEHFETRVLELVRFVPLLDGQMR